MNKFREYLGFGKGTSELVAIGGIFFAAGMVMIFLFLFGPAKPATSSDGPLPGGMVSTLPEWIAPTGIACVVAAVVLFLIATVRYMANNRE